MTMTERLHQIHGFAIVSDDDFIADASGAMPDALRNEADWNYFQEWLDKAALTILGRLSHEANSNKQRRRRLVISSSADGLERRSDGLWWNPTSVALADALAAGAPEGGIIAIPGGRRVFDLFLAHGYDAFHLSRAKAATLARGVSVFSDIAAGHNAEDVLISAGLQPGPTTEIDPLYGVDLTVFDADQ